MERTSNHPNTAQCSFGWLKILMVVVLTALVTATATVWAIKTYVFPTEFTPVNLNTKEEHALDAKLERLERLGQTQAPPAQRLKNRDVDMYDPTEAAALEPEPYSEVGASREVVFTERELNALLAKNTDLARKLAIDLSHDMVSAKLLVPVEDEFPVLGGKTLRVRTGIELAFRDKRPVVMLKGLSIMGVPLPSAWLGGLKNIDLVHEFGTEAGFWKAFAEGVDELQVEEGEFKIRLKE